MENVYFGNFQIVFNWIRKEQAAACIDLRKRNPFAFFQISVWLFKLQRRCFGYIPGKSHNLLSKVCLIVDIAALVSKRSGLRVKHELNKMSAIRKWAVFGDIRFPEPHVVILFTQNVRSQSSEPYLLSPQGES